jgi:hypothetical protein
MNLVYDFASCGILMHSKRETWVTVNRWPEFRIVSISPVHIQSQWYVAIQI